MSEKTAEVRLLEYQYQKKTDQIFVLYGTKGCGKEEYLREFLKEKDYFVLTTNVDHCFQKAGFDKNRIFYTQDDYGLFQCSEPCHAFYVCLNQSEAYAPEEIRKKSVCMNEDIGEILKEL